MSIKSIAVLSSFLAMAEPSTDILDQDLAQPGLFDTLPQSTLVLTEPVTQATNNILLASAHGDDFLLGGAAEDPLNDLEIERLRQELLESHPESGWIVDFISENYGKAGLTLLSLLLLGGVTKISIDARKRINQIIGDAGNAGLDVSQVSPSLLGQIKFILQSTELLAKSTSKSRNLQAENTTIQSQNQALEISEHAARDRAQELSDKLKVFEESRQAEKIRELEQEIGQLKINLKTKTPKEDLRSNYRLIDRKIRTLVHSFLFINDGDATVLKVADNQAFYDAYDLLESVDTKNLSIESVLTMATALGLFRAAKIYEASVLAAHKSAEQLTIPAEWLDKNSQLIDFYKLLNVDRNEKDFEKLKKAWRKLLREYHPDRLVGDPKAKENKAKYILVGEAKSIFSDTEKWELYNKALVQNSTI